MFETFDNKEKNIYRPYPGEIQSLNALKFICALMVIGLHIPFFTNFPFFIYRIAVPVFFMITGYFLIDNKGCLQSRKIVKNIKKVIRIIIVVNAVYIAYHLLTKGVEYRFNIMKFLLFGNSICGILWFLMALLQSLLLILVLVRFNFTRIIPILAVFGFVFNLITGTYSFYFFDDNPFLLNRENQLLISRNFFTIGFPCIVLGSFIRIKEQTFKVRNLLFLSLIFLIFSFFE